MANHSWQRYEQEVNLKLQGISPSKMGGGLSPVKARKYTVEDLVDCEMLVPLEVRFLFIRIFMMIRRQRHYSATKMWKLECEKLEADRVKRMSSQRLKLADLLKKGREDGVGDNLPPRPVIGSFLSKCVLVLLRKTRDLRYDKMRVVDPTSVEYGGERASAAAET